MIKKLIKLLTTRIVRDPREQEYAYLSEAVDIADLERRIRDIDMSRAPFQR